MYEAGSDTGSHGGSYNLKAAVIDTIVAEVQSVPGENRCMLLLGYKDQIVEMFQVKNILFSTIHLIVTNTYLFIFP